MHPVSGQIMKFLFFFDSTVMWHPSTPRGQVFAADIPTPAQAVQLAAAACKASTSCPQQLQGRKAASCHMASWFVCPTSGHCCCLGTHAHGCCLEHPMRMAAVWTSYMVGVGAIVASCCTPTASILLLCSFVFVITQHSCRLELCCGRHCWCRSWA
jgi:hypothetical protein